MELNGSSTIDMGLRKKAAIWSFLASFMVFGLKLVAFHWTNSTAILSDAIETIVNIVASAVALFVIQYVAEPADEDHPYGHGKAEYFSAAFEGGLIFFAALVICLQGIMALIRREPLLELQEGLVLVVIATVINLLLGLYLKKIGRTHMSETLVASGAHVISDVVTTGGVIVGLGLAWITGWTWIDACIALGVSVHLAWEGFKIMRRSIGGLIDETDHESLQKLCAAFEKNRCVGVINIHNLRTIRSGSFHHVDAHLVVPEFWDVLRVHTMSHGFEQSVVRDYPFDGEIAFHLDPCQRKYCSSCDLNDCQIRQNKFVGFDKFIPEELVRGPKMAIPSL